MFFIAVRQQGIQKRFHFDISMTAVVAANIVHFPFDLLKIVQSIRVLDKGFISVIFNSKVGEIDKSGSGGSPYSLFDGFGIITQLAAELAKCGSADLQMVCYQIVDEIEDVPGSMVANDA